MKGHIVLATILALTVALRDSRREMLVTKEMTELLKQKVSWKVQDYEDNIFKSWEIAEFANTFSGVQGVDNGAFPIQDASSLAAYPTEFDARQKWPQCKYRVRDQGNCGSCWSQAVTESLTDRLCAQYSLIIEVSAQDPVSCDRSNNGCGGGWVTTALNYLVSTGAVTESCFPYVSANNKVPPCPTRCVNQEEFKKYRCKKGSVRTAVTREAMKEELMKNGPVTSVMEHWADFDYYKEGVYYHYTGKYITLHAIKVLGWGHEDGMDYWLCANSHGHRFGIDGYFKIKMGDCGIDNGMQFCAPDAQPV